MSGLGDCPDSQWTTGLRCSGHSGRAHVTSVDAPAISGANLGTGAPVLLDRLGGGVDYRARHKGRSVRQAARPREFGVVGPYRHFCLVGTAHGGRFKTVIQGAFVLSKAANDQVVVIEAIDHLRRYLECVFGRASTEATT